MPRGKGKGEPRRPSRRRGAAGLPSRVWRFLTRGVWVASVEGMPWYRAWGYRAGRVLYGTVNGFFLNQLTVRAAALAYYTVLSVVPFLAFAFSILKGLGAYALLEKHVITPWVNENLSSNPTLKQAADQVLGFVNRTSVSSLGVIGLGFLIYTVVALLSSVESTFNDVWAVKQGRSVMRQVTDYISIVVIAPILVLVAFSTTTAAQSSSVVTYLTHTLRFLTPVVDFLLRFTSVAVAILAITVMYLIMPNTRTRITSAFTGGIIGGLLWQATLYLLVVTQMGVARYNALYSGFAAVPLFIFWIYLSWLTVLIGAQIAAAHQNEQLARQQMRTRHLDQATRESLAVAATARVTRSFLTGEPRWSAAMLADDLDVPVQALDDVLGRLTRGGVLVRVGNGGEAAYLPARDIDAARVKDVLDAVRRRRGMPPGLFELEPRLGPGVERVLEGMESDLAASECNLTLRGLAETGCEREPAADGRDPRNGTPREGPPPDGLPREEPRRDEPSRDEMPQDEDRPAAPD